VPHKVLETTGYNAIEVYLRACSHEDSAILGDLFPADGFAIEDQHYSLRPPQGFSPSRIFLAKGSNTTPARRDFVERICRVYPEAQVVEAFQTPHNRIALGESNPIELHRKGKRTLVLAGHNSAVRFSTEEDNSCPNYWHFSPYGFCPYGCAYCYLAGTQGVRFSPTVKVFLNLPEMLAEVDEIARRIGVPTAFYLGKLQDGLALDPLTGYSRQIVPFFADHPTARLTLLTKSADVGNLLDLDHRGHSILSWTVNPAAIVDAFEENAPLLEERIKAMEACASAGYPIRAVVMPIIPAPDWRTVYGSFLQHLLNRVRLTRITLGSICSYPHALRLTKGKLGAANPISTQLARSARGQNNITDGRIRFPTTLRAEIYRYLLEVIRRNAPALEIALCLEDRSMFDTLGMQDDIGRCNCVL
jgi:DNA repair photolyase